MDTASPFSDPHFTAWQDRDPDRAMIRSHLPSLGLLLSLLLACTSDPDRSNAAGGEPPLSASSASAGTAFFGRVEPILRPAVRPALVVELEGHRLPGHMKAVIFFGGGLAEAVTSRGEVRILDAAGATVARRGGFVTPIGLGRSGDDLLVWSGMDSPEP